MKYFFFLISTFLLLAFNSSEKEKAFATSEISIIPKPSKLVLNEHSFNFSNNTLISIENDEQKVAATFLADLLKKATNYHITINKSKTNASIVFSKIEGLKPEEYQLQITTKQITIKATDIAGYFYGVQTLRQLLPPAIETTFTKEKEQNWILPCVNISDTPRFSWRGMQMDFSRHFFDIDEVKTFLQYMALYKLNKYHMHLTDDQGWRVEIKKYPLLTQNGAWRTENDQDKECNRLAETNPMYIINKKHFQQRNGEKMYGGFFTQDQIKEIITYASKLNIEVIPEIDMPGHFKSAIDNYPFLSCTEKAGWGEQFSQPLCLGKETSYHFAKEILTEIAALFPSKYIHIGGDEVNIASWKACPNCQKTIKKHDLKDEHELQSFFNKDIEKFLKAKGKKLIGWDEIVEGGLSKDATVMWWRNWAPKARNIAANNGSNVVITPDFEYYFDFKNEATPLEKVYQYEPIPEDFTELQAKQVIGIQANLWSEYIPNFERLQYQTFPRMLAIAETGWTGKSNKNYDDFTKRVDLQYQRLDNLKITYYIPSVKGLQNKIAFIDKATITLESPLKDMTIYYTLDGNTPSNQSIKYSTPIEIIKNTTLKVISYRGKIASEIKTSEIEKQTFTNPITITPQIGTLNRWVGIKLFSVVEDVSLPANANFKTVDEINLSGYEDGDQVSIIFKGYFFAEEDGLFEFSTKSDDGSLLYIGDKLVVNNGGNHAAVVRDGMIALKKGWHPLLIKFHESTGGSELNVWYKSPNNKKQLLKGKIVGY